MMKVSLSVLKQRHSVQSSATLCLSGQFSISMNAAGLWASMCMRSAVVQSALHFIGLMFLCLPGGSLPEVTQLLTAHCYPTIHAGKLCNKL